jgi:hypothetical protein
MEPTFSRDRPLPARYRTIVSLVLAAVPPPAVLIELTAPRSDANGYGQISNNIDRLECELAVAGGKTALSAKDLRARFGGPWRGKGLAHTLAFLSVGGSAACFAVAHRPGSSSQAPGGPAPPRTPKGAGRVRSPRRKLRCCAPPIGLRTAARGVWLSRRRLSLQRQAPFPQARKCNRSELSRLRPRQTES